MSLPRIQYEDLVRRELGADLGQAGDLTTDAIVPSQARARAEIVTRGMGRLCGVEIALTAFDLLGGVESTIVADDGEDVEPGAVVARLVGPARTLLSAERTALNLLAHLSGVATATRDLARIIAAYPVASGGFEMIVDQPWVAAWGDRLEPERREDVVLDEITRGGRERQHERGRGRHTDRGPASDDGRHRQRRRRSRANRRRLDGLEPVDLASLDRDGEVVTRDQKSEVGDQETKTEAPRFWLSPDPRSPVPDGWPARVQRVDVSTNWGCLQPAGGPSTGQA